MCLKFHLCCRSSRENSHRDSSHEIPDTQNYRPHLPSNGTTGGELPQQHNQRNKGYDIAHHSPNTITNSSDNTQTTSSRLNGAIPADMKNTTTRTCQLQTSVVVESIASALDGNQTEFLPADALKNLICEDNVVAVLEEAGIKHAKLNDLVKFVLIEAKRTFATLLCINRVDVIQEFFRDGFTDEDLPIGMRSRATGDVVSLPARSQSKPWALFETWEAMLITSFRRHQWSFLAPIFDLQLKFEYVLEEGCLLPFIEMQGQVSGNFSTVYRMIVHPAHINGLLLASGQNPVVAVKELRRDPSDTVDHYLREYEVLDIIRKINHEHLIKAIAAVIRGPDRYFIFPWAEGGNLRNYWQKHDSAPRDHELLSWIIHQLYGLFKALRTLHYFDENRNCRHGDLKPENILLFQEIDGKVLPRWGRLVIADLGLTKFHSQATQARAGQATSTMTGTQKYEPPETDYERGEHGKPRSRLYDMWSMGCIVLETVIWILYGFSELNSFSKGLDKFWHDRDGGPHVHAEVEKWFKWIEADPRCATNTMMKDLLNIIRSKLLVVNIDESIELGQTALATGTQCRAYCKELEERMGDISEKSIPGSAYLGDTTIWKQNKHAAGPKRLVSHKTGGLLSVQNPNTGAPLPLCETYDSGDMSNSDVLIQLQPTSIMNDPNIDNDT